MPAQNLDDKDEHGPVAAVRHAFSSYPVLSAIGAVIDVLAAGLALILVRKLTTRQNEAFDSWVVEEPTAPQGATALDARGL